ncbi:interferon-induced 6-16 [Fusarium subglutinans]|uniref:Interferon-induced 6-16 n=1 Tax=Gibberella subglutinans TaxID=42677 RepID=A0A8H5PXC3_GIBSU|nr:interferon-induced 6-16 [Fusarium subglutinans]KAF5605335.1 interferon-induced 6-16 [Fusarium subglutinans]
MTSPAMMVTGTALIVAPAIVVGPALGALGFGVGGIAAGSAAAGIQSGIGSVVAGSPFAILQSAGAGGAGLAIVNGVVQASGAIVGASGLAAKLKGKLKGQGDEHSANGDQEETDGGNDAEKKVSQSKKN